jgi:hypothetical protein
VEDSSYLFQLLAGVFFIAVSIPLLRRGARSGERPERMLGSAFLLFGISYFFYQLPMIPTFSALWVEFTVIARLTTAAGLILIAFFTRLVFRRDALWAKWMARGCTLLLIAGITVSFIEGDWEGYRPLSSAGFWLEWIGLTAPGIWVAVEGFANHRRAAKRMALGLCDPMVANRFLIWGLFGVGLMGAMIVVIPMNIEYELYGTFSTWADATGGIVEMFTIATVWFAFYPPVFYRSWIGRRAVTADAGGAE